MLKTNEIRNGKLWLAGVGPRNARVMVVTPVATEDEVATTKKIGWEEVPKKPRALEYDLGITLRNIAMQEGLDLQQCFCVPLVRYMPEDKKERKKPKTSSIEECLPELIDDIKSIKPQIIICVGKLVFDALVPGVKFKESDIYGAWFYRKDWNCRIYPTIAIGNVTKPERYGRYSFDFKNVVDELRHMDGKGIEVVKQHYEEVTNAAELFQLVNKLRVENATILSVDCEWHGRCHVDGKLRSLQICWKPGYAACISFMDDQCNYTFDIDYKKAGAILGTWCNRPEVKYIGHHLSADLAWMHYWLGLNYIEKGLFDSEFALQACDEASDLGLDALALRYTDLGKYDLDLIIWKKTVLSEYKKKGIVPPEDLMEGYGYVPKDILVPYSNKDVDTVMRAYPIIWKEMERQNLVKYYNNILNPMVTDVFTFLTLKGIPVDKAKMDEMRDLYNWAKDEMQIEFRAAMTADAETILKDKLKSLNLESVYQEVYTLVISDKVNEAKQRLKNAVGVNNWTELSVIFDHYLGAPGFNIRSKNEMCRWLFDVRHYVPIKSTSLKDQGMPAMAWDKVLALPEEKQKQFTPATDKGTLEVFASRYGDKVIALLLELNAIGNICKAFLKPADLDEDGNVVGENGLHSWLQSDEAIHPMSSTTETGRPRSWNPNILNWPSYIHARLGAGVTRIIKLRHEQGRLPERFEKFVNFKGKNFPTVRGVAMAKPGWCMPEADLQTAEMRGLAFISGDKKLLKMLLEPDECFAYVDPKYVPEGMEPSECIVRIQYPDYVTLPVDKDKYIMTYTTEGVTHGTFTEDQLLRDEKGNIVSPRFDMHWGVLELARHQRMC